MFRNLIERPKSCHISMFSYTTTFTTLFSLSLIVFSPIRGLVPSRFSQNAGTLSRESSQRDPSDFPSGYLLNLSQSLNSISSSNSQFLILFIFPFSQPARVFSTALNYVSLIYLTIFLFMAAIIDSIDILSLAAAP